MNAIFAVNRLNGFGVNNDMPWPRNKVDLQRFKELTTGHTVIMGSATWNSNMPKPLPNRRNIVLSKTLVDNRCEVYGNIYNIIDSVKNDSKVFVIGGAKVLWLFHPFIDNIYLTIHNDYSKSDIFLDLDKYLINFKLTEKHDYNDHEYFIYKRI